MKKSSAVRFGVMSTAKIGREHVIPALQAADHCRVSAIASRELSRAREMADHFGVNSALGSYEALLESDEVDAVYIPLPTSQHVEWAVKAAAAGKHVLCEKPIALKAGDIRSVVRARDTSNVIVSEAFMITYHPQWLKVRDLIARGAIGTLRQVDASFSYYNIDPENMRNRPELGGGIIPDIAVYPIVATRFATGEEPERLQATVEFDPKFGTDRYASIRAEFHGFELSFYVSMQMANRQTMVLHGDRGFIELSAPFNSNLYEGDELRLHDRGHGEVRTWRYTGIDQYRLQVEAFARVVMGKKQPLFTLEDSIRNQRVIDAIYKAGKSGRWERVPS